MPVEGRPPRFPRGNWPARTWARRETKAQGRQRRLGAKETGDKPTASGFSFPPQQAVRFAAQKEGRATAPARTPSIYLFSARKGKCVAGKPKSLMHGRSQNSFSSHEHKA